MSEMPSGIMRNEYGYRIYPDGFIEQWGVFGTDAFGRGKVTFPVPFTHNYKVIGSVATLTFSTPAFIHVKHDGLTAMEALSYNSTTGSAVGGIGGEWFAVGY